MSNRSIRWVIGFGVLAILAILAGQGYFFYQAFDMKERQTVQSLRISLQSVAESICRYNECTLPDNIIHEYSPDYYIVDINNHIDPWILEHYLRSELNRHHLDIDFEYAIYDCNDDRMMYGDYVSLDEKEGEKQKLEDWPKYEQGLYYFGVHFPGMRNYILGEMRLWYFFTAILVLVIAFFGYTMMVILHQKRLSEVQRDFINNMSHEFRTPLTSIGLAANVIDEEGPGGNPERLRKFSAILKGQTEILQKKVDRILLQAETEHRFFRLNRDKLILEQLIEEVIEEFKPAAVHRNGKIEFVNQAPGGLILADRFHLSGMLINLVDNALKYSERPPSVTISLTPYNGRVLLRVADNGVGIDRKNMRRIFMPFYRVPSGNIHNVKGSGLGLTYVKKVCDLHGWRIRMESEPGAGTTVSVIIPKAG